MLNSIFNILASFFGKKRDLDLLRTSGSINSPFLSLQTLENTEKLEREFIEYWVPPIPVHIFVFEEYPEYISRCNEITIDQVKLLLGERDWRPRSAGAFYSAIRTFIALEPEIGNLLLKNEFGMAGHGYSLCLASFKTKNSINFLTQYLDYYLTSPPILPIEDDVMAALAYIDKCQGTNYFEIREDIWYKYYNYSVRKSLQLGKTIIRFEEEMRYIEQLKRNTYK